MTKEIEPKLTYLKHYMCRNKEEVFIIPRYQRQYSWTIEQCDKLFQDIERYIVSGGNDPYFFGTIIIDCSKTGEFHLIDGQQRTTTFVLLLKALLIIIIDKLNSIQEAEETERIIAGLRTNRDTIIKILHKVEDEDIPDYLRNQKSYSVDWIKNLSINEMYKDEINIILSALTFEEAKEKVFKIKHKKFDNKYTQFFKNFKFFYEKLKEKGESEILLFAKTLLSKCQVIEIRSWNIEQAIVMFNSLNSKGMPLSDANILSAELFANCHGDESVERTFMDLWETILDKSENIGSIDEILNQYMYIKRAMLQEKDTTLPSMRRYFKDIHPEFLETPIDFANDMSKIIELWETPDVEIKQWLAVLSQFNSNFKLFYITYAFLRNSDSKENLSKYAKALLRLFVLLSIVDYGYSSKNFKSFLFSINMSVGNNENIDNIIATINNHIALNFSRNDIFDRLLEIYANAPLVVLNEFLFAIEKNLALDFLFDKSFNVEHIMPNSGRNIVVIRTDAKMSDDEFKNYVNKLGNKIMLEENINKSLGNEWFKTKKQTDVNSKTGYINSKYPIAKSLTSYGSDLWTKADIDNATQKAAMRICDFIFGEE